MRTITFTIAACLMLIGFGTQAQSSKNATGLDAQFQARMAEHTIAKVEIGMLMCEDANGNMIICSGDEFEKVLGFATSTPYVTVNKRPKGENQNTYEANASMDNGQLNVGDYVNAGKNGSVKKCTPSDFPYAKVIATNGQKVTVRILGGRR